MLQNATLSGNQRPDLLTCFLHCFLLTLLKLLQNHHVLLTFDKVHNPLRLPRKTPSESPKVLRTRYFFALLTSKCASRQNAVHLFNISTSKSAPKLACFVDLDLEMCFAPQRRALFNITTSKSAPKLVCFVDFDLEICFAPQRRALFQHHNFQKCSEAGVLCRF